MIVSAPFFLIQNWYAKNFRFINRTRYFHAMFLEVKKRMPGAVTIIVQNLLHFYNSFAPLFYLYTYRNIMLKNDFY